MKRTAALLAVLLSLIGGQVLLAQSPEKPETDPAVWVPDDALFYVGVTDVTKTWEDFQKTADYKMMNDPAAAEAVPGLSVVGPAVDKIKERIAKALDVPPSQLKNPFSGPLAFYLTLRPGGASKDIEPGLVAQVGDPELMKKYYDATVAKLKESSKHDTDRVATQLINVFTTDPEAKKAAKGDAARKSDKGGDDEELDEDSDLSGGSPEQMISQQLDKFFSAESLPESLAMCLTDDRLIVAGTAEQVKAALKRDATGKNLAGTDDHKALLKYLKPTGTVRVLLNIPRIVEMAKAEAGQSDAEELRKTLQIIGTDSLRSIIGHVSFAGTTYDKKIDLLLLMSGERTGLAKILSMENRPVAPPASVTADTCAYASLTMNVPKLLDDIERILRQSDPKAADEMRSTLEAMPLGAEPVNVRKELFDHLTGPLATTLSVSKPVGPNSVRLLLSIGHRDQSAVTRFLSKVAEMGMMQARDLRGTQVFDMIFPPGISMAAASDRLLLGNTAAVEGGLESSSAESLAASEGWRRAAKVAPEEAWLTMYMDKSKLLTAAIELAKGQPATAGGMDIGSMVLSGLLGSMTENMDEEAAKKAGKLLQYTTQTIVTAATTPEGIRITQVDLKPE